MFSGLVGTGVAPNLVTLYFTFGLITGIFTYLPLLYVHVFDILN